jgi:toxin ParE1/3/4
LSRAAESDLVDIANWTLRTWGYIDDLEACCRKLARSPDSGRRCDRVRPGLRRMEHGSHVIFFRSEPAGILVYRILHRRMLPERHRADDDET